MKGKSVNVWYFDSGEPRCRRKGIYSPHKLFLYEVIYRSLTQHNISECRWVLRLLPRMTNIDPYVIFRFAMIMIHSVDEKPINSNFMIYLQDLFSKLELSKPDIFMEILTYFLSKNRIEDARELFNTRHRKMTYHFHREVPLLELNVGCYDLLFNYLAWEKKLPHQDDIKFDVSTQGWLVNAMRYLKGASSNHELFVMGVARVLLYYGFHRKAYLFLSEFQRSNPDNLTAQLLLFNLLKSVHDGTPERRSIVLSSHSIDEVSCEEARSENRLHAMAELNNFTDDMCNKSSDLSDFPLTSDLKSIFNNLLRLDPNSDEVFELSASYCDQIYAIRLLMDSLENLSEIRRASKWHYLKDTLKRILASGDELLIEEFRLLWQTRYFPFWRSEDFLLLATDSSSSDGKAAHRKVIKSVFRTLSSQFDPVCQPSPELPEQDSPFSIEDYYDIEWDREPSQ